MFLYGFSFEFRQLPYSRENLYQQLDYPILVIATGVIRMMPVDLNVSRQPTMFFHYLQC